MTEKKHAKAAAQRYDAHVKEQRDEVRAAKKAAKAERAERAQRPEQVAKKAALVSSIENGRRARAVMDAEGKEAVLRRMRREALGEVDTDGEE